MLLKFIHDLKNDEKVQRAFSENPKKAMKQAGLSARQQSVFNSRNRQRILNAMLDELSQSPIIGTWVYPDINLLSIKPSSGSQGQTLQVTLTGQWFTVPMTANIENNTQKVPITIQSVTGAGEEKSQAAGSLVLPASLPTGPYTVRVTSDTKTSSTLSMGFTVKASSESKTPAGTKKAPASKTSGAKKTPTRGARGKTPKK
ncbi:hypothetical protein [Archangium lansingense]|uniref:Uncharacterized protein n=1 Tax=Archangium lansingense TaxID=2995310 RepID=A0ABT4AJ96_9BACT|nr:hypothetical protein [Archangium lansinium]MCY1080949.1 hypothetical protein [Archangium lansinium]